jgi:flagellar biogenesis protein FliO
MLSGMCEGAVIVSPQSPRPHAYARWLPVTAIGLIAVVAGVALPQALPSVPPAPKAAQVTESADKSKLTYTPPVLPEAPDARSMFTRLGLVTAGVLALCVGSLWLCRRWLVQPAARPGAIRQLQLVESLSLGNRCTVHLVHVANRPVLVGADAGGVRTIVPLPDTFEQVLAQDNGAEATPPEAGLAVYQRAAMDALREPLQAR